jgi:ABC-2 type transport system permease protein
MTDLVWTTWVALRTEQRGMRGNPLIVLNAAVQPVVFLLITVGTRAPDPAAATSLVSAVMFTAVWSSTVWMAGGVLRRERNYGTLARSVTSVRPTHLLLLGKSLGSTLYTATTIVVSTTAAVLLIGVPVRVGNPFWLVVAYLAVILSGTALGMLLSCLFLVTRHGLAWSSALMYPVFILGGLLIPHDVLPRWLEWVPSLVSLRWLQEFVTGAATGTPVFTPLLIAAALTVAYFLLAVWGLNRAVDVARRKGTLDLA